MDDGEIDYKEAQLIFEGFLKTHCRDELMVIVHSENDHDHFAVHINALELFDTNMLISTRLLNMPLHLIPFFERAALAVQNEFCRGYEPDPSDPNYTLSVKENCHVRISNLPICPELTRDRLPKCQDVGSFLAMTGTVIRCTVTKLLEYERQYICNKCRHIFTVQAEFEQKYQLPKPTSCSSPDGCTSVKFTCLADQNKGPAKCKDYQELKIQEQIQRLDVGNIPRSIWVVLEDDLVDKCKPGDDVTVSGVVLRRWQNVYQDTKCEIELVIKASDVVISNDQRSVIATTDQLRRDFTSYWEKYQHSPLEGRNKLLAAFCPQVFGLYVVKLAVSLALIGGVQRIKESGTRIRGESHLLLVGDPGTGKSQFLKYAAKLMPRSVLTTGIGSTSAGLTVTAVKDSGEWQLEAGALVLADGGICCIDEFNSIREHDRTSIHEAMEQQTISVAKAGLVCKLNTRTTILAATNPKGKYDQNESIMVNTALASPLLSRFDVVLVLIDNQNEEWDDIISDFILRKKRPYDDQSEREFWTMERMQSYFSYVRMKNPALSEDSMRILQKYYQLQRATDLRNAARTTIRMLESVIRLAEAHARLMFRDDVTIQDAVVAVCVMESSMQNTSLFEGLFNPLYSAFPEDADGEYFEQAKVVLTKLNLPDILKTVTLEGEQRKEMRRMGVFQQPMLGDRDRDQLHDNDRVQGNQDDSQLRHNDRDRVQSEDTCTSGIRDFDQSQFRLDIQGNQGYEDFQGNPEFQRSQHSNDNFNQVHCNYDNVPNDSIDLNIERLPTKAQEQPRNSSNKSERKTDTNIEDYSVQVPKNFDGKQGNERSLIDIFNLEDDEDNDNEEISDIQMLNTKPLQSRANNFSLTKDATNNNPLYGFVQSQPELDELPDFEDEDFENIQLTSNNEHKHSPKDLTEAKSNKAKEEVNKCLFYNIVQTPPEFHEFLDFDDEEIGSIQANPNTKSSKDCTNPNSNTKENLTKKPYPVQHSIVQTPPDFVNFDEEDNTSEEMSINRNSHVFSNQKIIRNAEKDKATEKYFPRQAAAATTTIISATEATSKNFSICSGAFADTVRIGTAEREAEGETVSKSFFECSLFNHGQQRPDATCDVLGLKRRKLDTDVNGDVNLTGLFDKGKKFSESELLMEAVNAITQSPDEAMTQSPMTESQQMFPTEKRFKFRKK